MDKQIIIDGVDVSGCEFYWLEKDICNNGNLTSDCQEHKDCIYKRYIRKEQECENNKTAHQMELDIYNQECLSLQEELKAKEQECKRLKKAIKLYNCIEKWGTKECHCACRCLGNEFCNDAEKKINQLKAENEILEKVNKNNQEKIKKLNETLEEEFIAKQYGDEALFFTLMDIKEIAETAVKGGYATKSFDYTQGMETIGSYVLQKIKEVIKDEE